LSWLFINWIDLVYNCPTMKIELKALTLQDWEEIQEMLLEIWPGENGFENHWYDMQRDDYLCKYYNQSQGNDLPEWYVPQTIYRLYVEDKIVGYGKLRHYLTEKLLKEWGHIGYCIRPSERWKGYGNIILKELLRKAQEKWITKVLLTCNETNVPSRKIIELNGGVLESIETKCKYWIEV